MTRPVHPWEKPPPRSDPAIRPIVATYDSMFDAGRSAHRLVESHLRTEFAKHMATVNMSTTATVGGRPLVVLNWEEPLWRLTDPGAFSYDTTLKEYLRALEIVREICPDGLYGFYDLTRWFGSALDQKIERQRSFDAVEPLVVACDIIVPSGWLHPYGQIGPVEIEQLVYEVIERFPGKPVWPVVSSLLPGPRGTGADGTTATWTVVEDVLRRLAALPIAGLIPFDTLYRLIAEGEVYPGSQAFYPWFPKWARLWLATSRYRNMYARCVKAMEGTL